MKLLKLLAFCLFVINYSFAQTISYSPLDKTDKLSMYFKVLGNLDGNTYVHKAFNKEHYISVYNNNMLLVNTIPLKYIDESTVDIDFLMTENRFSVMYINKRNRLVTFNVARYNENGKLLGPLLTLDTLSSPDWDLEPQVYRIKKSENEQMLLLHNLKYANENILFSSITYDKDFNRIRQIDRASLDSTGKKLILSDIEVDNSGNFFFTSENANNENDVNAAALYAYSQAENKMVRLQIPMYQVYTGRLKVNIDNAHNLIFVSGLLYSKFHVATNGILTIALDKNTLREKHRAHTAFSDDLHNRMTVKYGKTGFVYDHFIINRIIPKADSGVIVVLEENYIGDGNTNYYNPFLEKTFFTEEDNSRMAFGVGRSVMASMKQDLQKHSNDIILIGLDGNLNKLWETPIYKKQNSYDPGGNFLSYQLVNQGAQVHFLFLNNMNNKQVLNNYALQPNGEIKRYPTIKSSQGGLDFMPRHGVQITNKSIVIPAVSKHRISFARINF